MNDTNWVKPHMTPSSELRILHIYGPAAWHDPVVIVGSRAALTALRASLDAALETSAPATTPDCYTADGEGFFVTVQQFPGAMGDPRWQGLATPYSDPMAADPRPSAQWPTPETLADAAHE